MIPRPYHWAMAALISSGAHVAAFSSGYVSLQSTADRSAGVPDVVWGVAATSFSQSLDPVETGGEKILKPLDTVDAKQPVEIAETREPVAALAALSQAAPRLVLVHEIAERAPAEILKSHQEHAKKSPVANEAARKPKKRNKKTASLGGPVGQQAGAAGKKKSATSGSASAARYAGRVLSHLHRFKRYPAGARAGTVRLVFVLGSNGSVRSVKIIKPSGSRILDKEAVATVRRAAPFPSFPSGVKKAAWTFAVPIKFTR